MNTNQGNQTALPIRYSLSLIYAGSIIIATLMATVSIAGIACRRAIYPTEELFRTFASNDVVNLIIGLPIMLGSMWLAARGKLIGLLCWPGALFFVFYNYAAYVFAMPFTWLFPLHLTLTMLTVYTLIGLVAGIDGKIIHQRLGSAVPVKIAGGVLSGFGLLFLLRVIGVLAMALVRGTLVAETELAVNISDFFISPALLIGGILLWRRRELGYVTGLGLLFQASMSFISLIVFLLLQPFLTAAPFAAVDVIVVFGMGLICFVPFALFAHRVMAKFDSPRQRPD